MSMKHVNKRLTICEVVREINDLHQSNSAHDCIVRGKLSVIEKMAKRMTAKLAEYKLDKQELFPDKNENYRESKTIRKNKEYKVGE